jgi:hypothetical protein
MNERARLSRRALLATVAVSTAASGQQPAAGQEPASAIEAARRQQQDDYEQMRKTDLPLTVEPATVFRA